MTKELPLEEFINVKNIQVCNENSTFSQSSNSITNSSKSVNNLCNSSVTSSNSSNSIVDSSSSTSLSSTSSSFINSQDFTNSSSVTLESKSNSSEVVSSLSKNGFLDFFFNPIKANAVGIAPGTKVDGYRLPYQKDTKIATYRGMNENLPIGNDTHNGRNALDFTSFRNNFEFYNADILAAKGGKVVVSVDSTSGFGKHIVIKQDDGHYGIYGHLSSRTSIVSAVVKRADKLGVQGTSGNSNADHLHFEVLSSSIATQPNCTESNTFSTCYSYSTNNSYKIVPQFDECFANRGGADENQCKVGTMNEGYPTISQSYSSGYYWTSINASNTNNYGGFIKTNSNNQLVFDIVDSNGNDQASIKLAQGKWSGGSENQRWGFISSSREIRGMNNKCLDAGNVNDSSNRWLRMSSCHGGNNQKWEKDSSGRVHSLENFNQCIDAFGGGIYAGQTVGVWDCHSGDNQKWNVADLNMPLPAQIIDSTMTQVQPPLNDWQRAMDSGCSLNSIVVIKQRYGNDCQKMKFNWGDSSIRNPFGQCLDAGNMNGSQKLMFYSCNGSNNQRWRHDGGNGRIWTLQKDNYNRNRCIEYSALNNGDEVYILPCGNDSRQKWYSSDLGIAQESLPTNAPTYNKYLFRRTGTNQCTNMYAPYDGSKVDTWNCNTGDNDQIFEAIPGQNGSFAYKKIGTNKCIDAWNPSNGTVVYAWTCDNNASNHNWYYDWSSKMFQQRNTSQCLARGNPVDGSRINTWGCNNNDGNLKWDAIQI